MSRHGMRANKTIREIECRMTARALEDFDAIAAKRKRKRTVRMRRPIESRQDVGTNDRSRLSEDRLYELSRIADVLEERLRTMEERSRS